MSSSTTIRPLFDKGYERISQSLSSGEHGNKLCQAFCGCGKSRFAYKSILNSIELGNKLNLILFPSIALITQFNIDYANHIAVILYILFFTIQISPLLNSHALIVFFFKTTF